MAVLPVRPRRDNHFEAGGFVRSNEDVAYPNLMFHFLPIAIRYDGSAPAGGHGYQVHIGPMYSDARGSVKVVAPTAVHPAIRFNYLSTNQDRSEWVEAIRVARSILSQPAFGPFDGGELSPGPEVATDEQVLDWVRSDGRRPSTLVHVSHGNGRSVGGGSPDDAGPRRRGTRVVDASAMPYVTNGNIYALP